MRLVSDVMCVEIRCRFWSLTCTAIVLNLCLVPTWAAVPGPVPASAPAPSTVLPSSTATTHGAVLERIPPKNESVTLLQVMTDSLEMSSAIKQSWTGEVCNGNVSSWVGVTCILGKLTGLDLTNHVQGGILPPQLYFLPSLTSFTCSHCPISGTLPPSLSAVPALRFLKLSSNKFTGTLPPDWGFKKNLQRLYLDNNNVTGTLPPAWGSMSNLQYLSLGNNRLSGTLPEVWGNMSQLLWVDLGANNIYGTLPEQWESLLNLGTLDLHNNQLSGTLPPWVGTIPSLHSLQLSFNKFTGTLPSIWGSNANLQRLYLNNNNVTGTLPAAWGTMSNLQYLYLGYNHLSGSIPGSSWALGMRSLLWLIVQSNSLTGQLPAEWFTTPNVFPKLNGIDVRWNYLHGPVPMLGNGSTFLSGINRAPVLIVLPMEEGYGLCGDSPKTGPLICESWDENYTGLGTTYLPPCTPDTATPPAADPASRDPASLADSRGGRPDHPGGLLLPISGVIGIAVGSASALAIACYVLCNLLQKRQQKAGSRISEAFVQSGHGLPKGPFAVEMSTPPTGARSGGSSGGADSKPEELSIELSKATQTCLTGTQSLCKEDIKFVMDEQGCKAVLGSGTYGKVYKATWHGVAVAVKVLKEESQLEMGFTNGEGSAKQYGRERGVFEQEAELLATLRHPNIVNFLGFSLSDDMAIVVTELCPGGDLTTAMQSARLTRTLGWYMRGAKIALDVACGLAYLHRLGVIHYDVKPGNVMLDNTGETAKISVLGISRTLPSISGTASANVKGKFQYMAPELRRGEGTSYAVDIFSFGVMLGEIITGETPDRRTGQPRDPRVPEECTEAVLKLYQRCVAERPETRPTSLELVNELRLLQPDGFRNPNQIL